MQKKWYQSSGGTVVFLLLFFPFGLYLMWKYTNWAQGIKIGITVLLLLLTIGVGTSGGSKKPEQKIVESKPAEVAAKSTSAFDVPALIGENIDQVRTKLGTPADKDIEPTEQQKQLGVTEWQNTFKNGSKELLVTFNSSSRSVVDYFISTDDSSGYTNDKVHLLGLGNLSESSAKYKVDFVKTANKSDSESNLTGVKITAQ
jgi:hypothetical protein